MDGIETYELQSQTVEIGDTTLKLDANGNPTSEIDNINENSFPKEEILKKNGILKIKF